MELILSKRFKKQAQKLAKNNPKLKTKINNCLISFTKKGRNSKYYRKQLKDNWYGYEELQVGGDLRIIIRINKNSNQAALEMIGTHSQLDL